MNYGIIWSSFTRFTFRTPREAPRINRNAHATPRHLNRVRDIVQEHLGFAPGDVSLRDGALVQRTTALVRRAARLSACGVATVALQIGYVTGLGMDARGAAPSAESKPYLIGIGGRWVLSLVLVVEL